MRGAWAAISNVFTAVPDEPVPPAPVPSVADDAHGYTGRLGVQLRRRPGRLVTACLATVLGPAVVAQAGAPAGPDVRAVEQISQGAPVPTTPVAGDPASWFPVARQAAATCPGLPSAVLVAIGSVESSMGVQSWTSSAGAAGPMQFLPSTWAAYGADGDGDGVNDIMNPVDAVYGAARLLCANGGADPSRLASAVWNYNHSDDYVRQVISLARFIPVGG